jgi:hypothetical protein
MKPHQKSSKVCTRVIKLQPRQIHQHFTRKRSTLRCRASFDASSDADNWALFIECDGALLDAHNSGHRVAFNQAFIDIGYNCVDWTPKIYNDLIRLGDGTGEGLIRIYYEMMGWPIMLPTKERAAFTKKVHAEKCRVMAQMAAKGEIPLRPGVAEFIDEALSEGVKIGVISCTASAPEDSLLSSAMLNLGPSRASKIQILGAGALDGDGDDDNDDTTDSSTTDTTEDQFSIEALDRVAAKAKSVSASSFVRAMNLSGKGLGVTVDPALLAARIRGGLHASPSYLAAVLATFGVPSSRAVMVSASHSLMESAAAVGVFNAGVPPSFAGRGGYSAMDAGFDGFGRGGGVYWEKVKLMARSKQAKQGGAEK